MEKTIQQITAELDSQVVDRIGGRDVTRADLSKAFGRVEPKDHWKNPIDAHVVVPAGEAGELELETIGRAVTFFTGSKAEFFLVRAEVGLRTYRVKAAGYFAAIGA